MLRHHINDGTIWLILGFIAFWFWACWNAGLDHAMDVQSAMSAQKHVSFPASPPNG